MMKTCHSLARASTAIAAALALAPTTAFAQVADPTISPAPPVMVFPETVAPPVQPTIVIPPSLPEAAPPVEAERTVQPTPATPAASTTTTSQSRAAVRPAAAPVGDIPATRPAAAPAANAEPVAPLEAASREIAQPEPSEPVAPIMTANEPQSAAVETQGDSTPYLPLALGGLAALGLAIWGFVAIGRRKPLARKAAVVERPIVANSAIEPVSTPAAPLATPVYDIRPIAPAPAASLAHTGASVALPRNLPQSYEERDALLKRMVAAKPDRANPFTAYKSRVKRARLILQSLGRDFSNAEPWIDLSQYSANWPELARSKYAAA